MVQYDSTLRLLLIYVSFQISKFNMLILEESYGLPSLLKINVFGKFRIIYEGISIALQSIKLLVSMLFPQTNFFLRSFNHPLHAFLRQIFRICTAFVTSQNIETCSSYRSFVQLWLKKLFPLKEILSSDLVLFQQFTFIPERRVTSRTIDVSVYSKDSMHVSSSSRF